MDEKFNQQKYIQEYNKEHYKAFKVDLKVEEMEHINKLLKENNMTKADFLRLSIKSFEKNINKKQ